MTVTFAVESWESAQAEAAKLWPAHYDEVGQGKAQGWPLDPDFRSLAGLSALGRLHIVVARSAGRIVGYHMSIVETMLHYRTVLVGKSDLYWLAPEFRNGPAAIRLFEFVEKSLRARGARGLYDACKVGANDHSRLFEHLGYELFEKRFFKCLN